MSIEINAHFGERSAMQDPFVKQKFSEAYQTLEESSNKLQEAKNKLKQARESFKQLKNINLFS